MKLKRMIKWTMAAALVFGTTSFIVGCDKDDDSSKVEDSKQYEIYTLAVKSGATDLTYEEWLASIRGQKGDKGDPGAKPVITIGNNGNWFIDGVDTSVKAQGSTGESGADGASWLTGTTTPNDANGKNGDFYFDSLTQKIYYKTNNVWVEKAVIEDGKNGTDGKQIEIRKTDSYVQWKYVGTDTWNNLISLSDLKGAAGEDGETPVITIGSNGNWFIDGKDTEVNAEGIDGVNGKDGATWLVGSVEDLETLTDTKVGDLYLNTTTADVFVKTPTGWILTANIKGASGSTGETGATGQTGAAGATWITGIEVTTDSPNAEVSNSKVGDLYLNTDTYDVFVKTANGWELKGNIKGTTGEAAATWLTGTVVTLDTLNAIVDGSKVGDLYLNTDTYDVFVKTATNWSHKGNIKGATGETGAIIEGVQIVNEDKWGIKYHLELTIQGKSETLKSETITNVDSSKYYGAFNEGEIGELIAAGVSKIAFTNDITLTHSLNIRENITFDLCGFTFYSYDAGNVRVNENSVAIFRNGIIDFSSIANNQNAITVLTGSKLILENVSYTSTGTAILVNGNSAGVDVKNSIITADMFAIRTSNASNIYNKPIINVINSSLKAEGHSTDQDMTNYKNSTAILADIPCELNIISSTLTADRQTVIVRGVDALVKDSILINTGDYALGESTRDKYTNEDWGASNEVPLAALVIGNRHATDYNNDTNITIENVEFNCKRYDVPTIYAYGNGVVDTNITYASEELNLTDLYKMNIEGDVFVTVECDSYDKLMKLAQTVVGMENYKVKLTQDIVYYGSSMTYDEVMLLTELMQPNDSIILNGYNVQAPPFMNQVSVTNEKELQELINMFNGNIEIVLANDIMTSKLSFEQNARINLNGHTLRSLATDAIVIDNGVEVTIANGIMDFNAKYSDKASIAVESSSRLTLNDVAYVSKGVPVLVRGDAAEVNINNSTITGGTYAVATNAAEVDNYGVVINLNNSIFLTTGYSADPNNANYLDDTALLVNVPSEVYITDSTFYGDRQAAIIRGGNVVMEGTTLINTGKYAKKDLHLSANWGTGNEVPMAALVVGNRSTAYQYPTNLMLRNVNVISNDVNVPTIYAYSNTAEGMEATIYYDASVDLSNAETNNATFVLGAPEINGFAAQYTIDNFYGLTNVELGKDKYGYWYISTNDIDNPYELVDVSEDPNGYICVKSEEGPDAYYRVVNANNQNLVLKMELIGDLFKEYTFVDGGVTNGILILNRYYDVYGNCYYYAKINYTVGEVGSVVTYVGSDINNLALGGVVLVIDGDTARVN